jgi:putative DNA primase/helicase
MTGHGGRCPSAEQELQGDRDAPHLPTEPKNQTTDAISDQHEQEDVMKASEYTARIDAVRQRAHGRWTELLAAAGVDPAILQHRNGPCPLCGGTDRFQYTDKFGEGNYHCRQCGAGGGFKLLQAVKGEDFHAALLEIERCLGVVPAATQPSRPSAAPVDRMKRLVQRIWDEARPLSPGDEVDRYLRGRGLALQAYPGVLRFHPALGYFEKDAAGKSQQIAEYPAMLACVQGPDGQAVTLHRTYLQQARKLQAPDAKKLLSTGIHGSAVRLFEAGDELAICEGIETALAVHLGTGKAVWASLNAGNLEKISIPASVRRVCIYADNDSNGVFAGQYYAYALARRLKREESPDASRQVRVFVPRHPGTDWADVWGRRADPSPHGQAPQP